MLYVCPTPIGNLADITLRVLETLRQADLVAAEDTRRTRKLLSRYQISKPLASFHEHNELRQLPLLIKRLQRGENIALVSDAGMPGICDPGYRLVKAALDEGLPVEVLPGPSAIETALVASGLSTDSFVFLGYLPRKQGELDRVLEQAAGQERTAVAFESPQRLHATLGRAAAILGDRPMAVCRELSKKHEQVLRGSASGLASLLPERVKGEIVLVFSGSGRRQTCPAAPGSAEWLPPGLEASIRKMIKAGLSTRQAADISSSLARIPRNDAYQLTLKIKKEADNATRSG